MNELVTGWLVLLLFEIRQTNLKTGFPMFTAVYQIISWKIDVTKHNLPRYTVLKK